MAFSYDPRYQPGQTPQFGSFGPPNMSAQIQAGISKLADPFIARLRELQVANEADAFKKATNPIFTTTPSTTGPNAATPSPVGTPSGGVLGTPSDPFVNPRAARGNAGGSFTMGQGMDPGTGEPTPGGTGTVAPSSLLEAGKIGIAGVETGGAKDPYSTLGTPIKGGSDVAIGKYQVMASNVPSWTEKWLGQRMTPEEFRANPAAQERVFEGEFGSYLDKYGNLKDAASKWFTGRPLSEAMAAKDVHGTNTPEYIRRMYAHIQKAGGVPAAQPATAPTASFAPPVSPAPTPQAQAAVGPPAVSQGNPNWPLPRREGGETPVNAPQQVASLDPSIGVGQRQAAPEVPVRRVPTQAVGPDGQPLPPQQQPAAPLPSGQPPNEQPEPPPPPPVQPPPPPPPPPPAPTQQAALPRPVVAPSAPASAPQVAPAAITPPAAAGVPQEPVRMAQAQQAQGQRYVAPVDPVAERYWLAARQHAKTREEVMAIDQQLLALRQGQKPSIHVAEGQVVEYDPNTRTARILAGTGKPAATVEIEVGGDKQRIQWNPKSGLYDIPVTGGVTPNAAIPNKEKRDAERNLFNDFESTDSVKKYRELEQGVQGLKAAFTGGSASADLVATIQLFKAIDPNSTVTQNESGSVIAASGVPERLRSLFNQGVGEGGKFSPELRAEIFNTAQRLQQARVKQVEQHATAYRNRAKAYGLDPDRTIAFQPFQFEKAKPSDFPDISRRTEDGAPTTPRVTTPGSSQDAPIDVPNEAAANRMPKGTVVRIPGPDGKPRIGVVE